MNTLRTILPLLLASLLTGCAVMAAPAAPNPHLGCGALSTDIPGDIKRHKEVNALYALVDIPMSKIAVAPNPRTWQWAEADKIERLNPGKRILFYVRWWPEWMSKTNQAEHTAQLSNYVAAVARRYPNLWCIQVNNEPSGADRTKWSPYSIPQVTNDTDSLYSALIAEYKACKAAVNGTKVLIGGPAFSHQAYYRDADIILNKLGGAKYVDVVIVHDYSKKHPLQRQDEWTLPADQLYAKWRAVAGSKYLVVGEFGIYGQSASSRQYPNTGDPALNSGFTEQEAIRDAIRYAILMRSAGVDVIIPHILTNGSWYGDKTNNLEIAGYEYLDGSIPFSQVPMKSKTKAFLNTLRFLNGLTQSQITELASLIKQL